MIKRHEKNPLISPKDLKPTRPDFKIECTFNAGVTEFNGEIILLVRVAESVISSDKNIIKVPLLEERNGKCELVIRDFDRNDPKYNFSDTRCISEKKDPFKVFLTSLSHLRLARSSNGVDFKIDDKPFLYPSTKYEAFGTEDPRITHIDGKYYINYSAVSSLGITTALAVTTDFKSVERLGIIFEPDNRDVCFFPEKVNGKYLALHRPAQRYIGKPEMWLGKSDNLMYWGDHSHFLGSSNDIWDKQKLGGGAPVIKTDKGWLEVYHGVDDNSRYCLGVLLLDINDPMKIIAKSKEPLIQPETKYEIEGFFGNVVFACGALIKNSELWIYYGAADEKMCLGTISLKDLWKHLGV